MLQGSAQDAAAGQEPSNARHLSGSSPFPTYFSCNKNTRAQAHPRENALRSSLPDPYLCFSLQQVTCKSKYDVGVNEDCPQVYDAWVGLPSSGSTR